MSENNSISSSKPPPAVSGRPTTISLPSRTSIEALFTGGLGASPGPMTLVSSFFADNDPESDCRSFSQLLAGAVASPNALHRSKFMTSLSEDKKTTSGVDADTGGGGDGDFRFKQNRPPGLSVSQPQMFTVPPGLSPASLLESPAGLFPGQGPYGMSHQQALAHVTAQAHGLPSPVSFSSFFPQTSVQQSTMPSTPEPKAETREPSNYSENQPSSIVVDKPADDGYNWRKYGQKQVKGSDYPRSYYKCTHPSCPVKKKVERSLDGQVTEIIYKGQHNHQPPQPKRSKDPGNHNRSNNTVANASRCQTGSMNGSSDGFSFQISRKDQESSQVTGDNVSSDGEEVGDVGSRMHEGDEDERDPKRRNVEVRATEQISSNRTLTEPRIIVQTTSEVDLLDDGYRWRKYGQKVVKGNPYPRSYYKCTTQGCNVRKHIERAASDPKAVVTTYEGKHNHDIPAARNSSHNTANNTAAQLRAQTEGNTFGRRTDHMNNNQQPAILRLKEERIT